VRSAPPIRNCRAAIERPLPRPAARARRLGQTQDQAMQFRRTIRRPGERRTLPGFLRLVPVGQELPVELGRMPAGTVIEYDGQTWQVMP
jgi:hypothetical protein